MTVGPVLKYALGVRAKEDVVGNTQDDSTTVGGNTTVTQITTDIPTTTETTTTATPTKTPNTSIRVAITGIPIVLYFFMYFLVETLKMTVLQLPQSQQIILQLTIL